MHSGRDASGALIGRALLLDGIERLLEGGRVVTLTGLPGVGKSRLARETATRVARRGREGARRSATHVVDLAGLRDGRLLPHTVAAAVGVPTTTERPMPEALFDALGGSGLLLVLDNCEHLVASCARFAADLLRSCPGVALLVTSRTPLRVAAERMLSVAPLTESEAVAVFTRYARANDPSFVADGHDEQLVRGICRRLDCLPLALELAASQLQHRTVEELDHDLDMGRDLHRPTAAPVSPHHHRSLCTALGRSHELCAPADRLLWARLSVFVTGFTSDDAVAVCGDAALADVPGRLASLAESSLLTGRAEKFWLPVTVRTYGAARLHALGESSTIRARHLAWLAGREE
ncbi:ATP-binding protein [Streptomyces sp. NPDC050504]|uniref:ATP-binding protein n=1 Tax=Streptomyces sp. NPDC050504 TaxID=3365618 RepID=UPI0037B862BA